MSQTTDQTDMKKVIPCSENKAIVLLANWTIIKEMTEV